MTGEPGVLQQLVGSGPVLLVADHPGQQFLGVVADRPPLLGLVVDVALECELPHLLGADAVEGQGARQQEMQYDSQTEYVYGLVVVLVEVDLGGYKVGRPHVLPLVGQVLQLDFVHSQPEVNNLWYLFPVLLLHQDVLQFEVPMYYPQLVQTADSIQ